LSGCSGGFRGTEDVTAGSGTVGQHPGPSASAQEPPCTLHQRAQ
jgi:hypothetical protein